MSSNGSEIPLCVRPHRIDKNPRGANGLPALFARIDPGCGWRWRPRLRTTVRTGRRERRCRPQAEWKKQKTFGFAATRLRDAPKAARKRQLIPGRRIAEP